MAREIATENEAVLIGGGDPAFYGYYVDKKRGCTGFMAMLYGCYLIEPDGTVARIYYSRYRLVPAEVLTPGYVGYITCVADSQDTGIDSSDYVYFPEAYAFSYDKEQLYDLGSGYVSSDEQQEIYAMIPRNTETTEKYKMSIWYSINKGYATHVTLTFSCKNCTLYQGSAMMGTGGSITFYGESDGWEGTYDGISFMPTNVNFSISIVTSTQ